MLKQLNKSFNNSNAYSKNQICKYCDYPRDLCSSCDAEWCNVWDAD